MKKGFFPLFSVLALTIGTVPGLMAGTLPLDTWENFYWNDSGVLPAATTLTPWTFTTATLTQLQVTDGFYIGDEFSVAIAGTVNETVDTSVVNPAVDDTGGPGYDGPTSWADPDYSRAAISLGPGTYSVTIDIIRNAPGFTAGGAFVEDTDAPEPTSGVLLATGLLGAALWKRRRRVSGSTSG